MPLKTVKQDAPDALTLEWVLQVKNYKLTLDKKRCVSCQICSLACPKQAIKIVKQPKIPGQKTKKPHVDIDLAKCNFCGICDVTCPHGAVEVTFNGSHDLSILAKDSYPKIIREITVNPQSCPKDCVECEEACPFSLIKVTKTTDKKGSHLNIDKEHCPTCKVCEVKCPPGLIKVKKIFEGVACIDQEKCPLDCHDCLDVCPIPSALVLGENNKVYVNETLCTFCGACKNVCPVPEALTVKRTGIHHTPIHSGAWNKTLERLTSSADSAKELRCVASKTRRKLVAQRFELEEYHK
jgi:4Fe-4S ferredoxin